MILSDAVLMVDGPEAGEVHARRAVELAELLRLPGIASPAAGQLALCRAAAATMWARWSSPRTWRTWHAGGAVLAGLVRGVLALVEHDLPVARIELGRAVDVVLDQRATPLLAPAGAWILLGDVLDVDDARERAGAVPGGSVAVEPGGGRVRRRGPRRSRRRRRRRRGRVRDR